MSGRSPIDVQEELRRIATGVISAAGLELVDLSVRGSGAKALLRLDVDRAGPQGVDLDDCQRVSRAMSDALDETDLIPSSFVLEVSSPGADRPIRSADDIRRNTGRRVLVTADDPSGTRQSYRGLLVGAEDGCMVLSGERERRIRIPLDGIVKAQQELEL